MKVRSVVWSFVWCCFCLVIVASEANVSVCHNSYAVFSSSYQGSKSKRGRRKAEVAVTLFVAFGGYFLFRRLFVSFRFREALWGGRFDQRFARFQWFRHTKLVFGGITECDVCTAPSSTSRASARKNPFWRCVCPPHVRTGAGEHFDHAGLIFNRTD